jgi:hypothetical protein
VENTLKLVLADKDETSVKREQRRRREKEKQMTNFAEIQMRGSLRYKKENLYFKRPICGQRKRRLSS